MPTSEPTFAIAGDCVAAQVGRAARSRGLSFVGGPFGNGQALDEIFFDLRDGAFVLRQPPRSSPDVADLFRSGLPILSSVGFNTQRLARRLWHHYFEPQGLETSALSAAVIDQVLVDAKPGPLAFYRAAADHGCPVYAVHSPQRFPDPWFDLALRLEAAFVAMLRELGVRMVDARADTTDATGRLRPEFHTDREADDTHANDAWAGVVLDRFLEVSGAEVPGLGRRAALG